MSLSQPADSGVTLRLLAAGAFLGAIGALLWLPEASGVPEHEGLLALVIFLLGPSSLTLAALSLRFARRHLLLSLLAAALAYSLGVFIFLVVAVNLRRLSP